jgi:hypothetical protein
MSKAALTLTTLSTPVTVQDLTTPGWSEMTVAATQPHGVVHLLLERGLLLPMTRNCPACSFGILKSPLHPHEDTRYTDGWRLRCNKCKYDYGVRCGSLFEHYRVPLAPLAMVLRAFDARIQIEHCAKQSQLSYDTIASFYRSGRVALEVAEDHTMVTMKEVINKHLNRSTTVTMSDKHKSFGFLEHERRHFWCEKRKHGGRLWIEVEDIMLCDHFGPGDKTQFGIHTVMDKSSVHFFVHVPRDSDNF